MHDCGDTEVQVGHFPVEKVEDLCSRPAVELSFDPLGVSVRGELLTRLLCDQKQCIVLGVRDLELVGTKRADLLCGRVRVYDQGFSRAAGVPFLQGHTEIVLQRKGKRPVLRNAAGRNVFSRNIR